MMGAYLGAVLMLAGAGCGLHGFAPLGAVLIVAGVAVGLPVALDAIAALSE